MSASRDCPLDVAALLDRVDGDRDLLAELVALFDDEQPGLVAALRAAIAAGDGTALQRAAHTLKGAVSNFCAPPARELAHAMERAGASGDLVQATALLPELEASLAGLVSALHQLTGS
jgi:HPt (histidine-containing phosphotransfer) domain-containing protein